MKFGYVLCQLVGFAAFIILCFSVTEQAKKVRLLEEHTNVCGETLKAQQYQIDVISELMKAK
jgi:hypothetical protein